MSGDMVVPTYFFEGGDLPNQLIIHNNVLNIK